MEQDSTSDQQWVQDRIKAVSERYDAFDALVENGVELDDKDSTLQIQCPLPGHGQDNRPSARYYAANGSSAAHFYCFKCRVQLNGIGLMARMRGMEFMRALGELERRFSIKTPRRPEASIGMPQDRSGAYESKAWSDVPRMLDLLESKLLRLRSSAALLDYIKWCRVLDAVQWDLDHNGGQPTPQMVLILAQLRDAMNKCMQNADI